MTTLSPAFRDFVDAVRAASDIVAIIGRDVTLQPAGRALKACSPFHADKTPSFFVWPDTQSWYDFSQGGGLGGDVFAFVEKRHGVGFKDALFDLAQRAGVRRPDQDDASFQAELGAVQERREVERLLSAAATFYHRALTVELRERHYRGHYGFTDETIDELQLGWAPGDDALLRHFKDDLGVSREAALKTGLFVVIGAGTPRERVTDFFDRRLVFPYWLRGRAVYFIARRVDGGKDEASGAKDEASGAKDEADEHAVDLAHVTPDHPWEAGKYKKLLTQSERHPYVSECVQNSYFYGEDAAAEAVRAGGEDGRLLITEGVTDCISARQAGVLCISPVTTRFSKRDHPKLVALTEHVARVVICNDTEANGAGAAGALDTARALFRAGRDVRIATIPKPEGRDKIDVNELVAADGPQGLKDVLDAARSLPEYVIEAISIEAVKAAPDQVLAPVLDLVAMAPTLARAGYVAAIAKRFRLSKADVKASLKAAIVRLKRRTHDGGGELPQIKVTGRQESDLFVEIRQILVDWNGARIEAAALEGLDPAKLAPLFVRAGRMVRLAAEGTTLPEIIAVEPDAMYGYLARVADWLSDGENGVVAAKPPKTAAADCLAMPDARFGAIDAIATTPVFDAAGRLIDEPGYHREASLWFHRDPTLAVPAVAAVPTSEEVADAVKLINSMLDGFTFAEDFDKTHAVAALLLPFVRRMVDGPTPLHLFEAPTAGSGKSLLANAISVITTGVVVEARSMPREDDEIRKMITTELQQARPMIVLDNVSEHRIVDSASLAAILTATHWRDRVLGESRDARVPNNALWILTANNPRLSSELVRRCVRVRIDPGTERPEERTGFKHEDLIGWTRKERDRLVWAVLTLVRSWLAAGRPSQRWVFGSYPSWAHVVGGIVTHAGFKDFLKDREKLRDRADTSHGDWRSFAAAWWEAHRKASMSGPWIDTEPKAPGELCELCDAQGLMSKQRGDGNPRSQVTKFGDALAKAEGRVFRVEAIPTPHAVLSAFEVRLERANQSREKGHGRTYALRRVSEPEPVKVDAGKVDAGGTSGTLGSADPQGSPSTITASYERQREPREPGEPSPTPPCARDVNTYADTYDWFGHEK